MSNLSSKQKKKTRKPVLNQDNYEDSNYKFNEKELDLNEMSFELKKSKNLFFFTPKILLFGSLCAMIFFFSDPFEIFEKYTYLLPIRDSTTKALFFIFFCVNGFGLLFFPNTYFTRPHQVFWRFILATAVCYLALLVFLVFQSREDAMKVLHDIDHKLGKALPEKHYAEDCRIYTPENPLSNFYNIKDALDFYIIAHVLGWWVKMMIVRNWRFCFFLSVFFEFMEITFRHWLPNFYECWWDHIIIDILLCNGLGILMGEYTIKYYKLKRYDWFSNKTCSKKNFFENFYELFTIKDLKNHEWIPFTSLNKFFAVLWYIAFMMLVDMSNFFNKFVLWIPSSHIILQLRVYLWGLIAMSSTREYYEYVYSESGEIKSHCWICHLMLFIEYCILFKFSNGFFFEPFPDYVKFLWVLILMNISFFLGLFILKKFVSIKKIKN